MARGPNFVVVARRNKSSGKPVRHSPSCTARGSPRPPLSPRTNRDFEIHIDRAALWTLPEGGGKRRGRLSRHPPLPAFVHSFHHSFTLSIIRAFLRAFLHSSPHSFTLSIVRSFLPAFVHSFPRSFILTRVRSFFPSLVHSFLREGGAAAKRRLHKFNHPPEIQEFSKTPPTLSPPVSFVPAPPIARHSRPSPAREP